MHMHLPKDKIVCMDFSLESLYNVSNQENCILTRMYKKIKQ